MRQYESFFGSLVRVHAIARKVANEFMMEFGVSPLEAWILELVPEDGRRNASEMAEILDVPVSTVTRALWRMSKQDYVTLTKGLYVDSRVLHAELTKTGIMIRDNAAGFERDLDKLLLYGMKAVYLGPMLSGLVHILRNADSLLELRSPPVDED